MGTLAQSAAFESLRHPDGSLWSLSDLQTTSVVA